MSIFLTFHEKVYLILTNLGEKLEFRTISEKSDRNPSTAYESIKKGRVLNWLLTIFTKHRSYRAIILDQIMINCGGYESWSLNQLCVTFYG